LGVLHTERQALIAEKAKTGWLAARAFPTTTPHWLQWVADWLVLFCTLDDQVEKQGHANDVEAYLQDLLSLFRAGIANMPKHPVASAMMNLRQRLLELAPPGHFARFADPLEELFEGFVTEARNRERARIPDVASYLRLREVTVGVKTVFELADLLDGFNLPNETRAHPALRLLATRASNIVGCANDLFTYEKEILSGEIHNLVVVLMNEHGLTISEAVEQAVKLHDNEVRSFVQEAEQLPSFHPIDADVRSYVEMLQRWIRGHLDWAYENGRYPA
jgi:5-epi-alpha-selinene synthase